MSLSSLRVRRYAGLSIQRRSDSTRVSARSRDACVTILHFRAVTDGVDTSRCALDLDASSGRSFIHSFTHSFFHSRRAPCRPRARLFSEDAWLPLSRPGTSMNASTTAREIPVVEPRKRNESSRKMRGARGREVRMIGSGGSGGPGTNGGFVSTTRASVRDETRRDDVK